MGAFLCRTLTTGLAVAAVVVASSVAIPGVAPAYTDGPYEDVYYVNSCATSASALASAHTPARRTTVAAAAAMSCTEAHSRTEWYS